MSFATVPRVKRAVPSSASAQGAPSEQRRKPQNGEGLLIAPRAPSRQGAAAVGLMATDLVMLIVAVGLTTVTAREAGVLFDGGEAIYALPPLTLMLLWSRGMYARSLRMMILESLVRVIAAVSVAAMTLLTVVVLLDGPAESGQLVLRTWAFATLTVSTGRVAHAVAERAASARGWISRPTLIIGAGWIGDRVARRLQNEPRLGLRPVGFLDAEPPPSSLGPELRLPVLGAPSDLAEVAERTGARVVIVAFCSVGDCDLLPMVRACDQLGLKLILVPRLFESINRRARLDHLGGLPVFALQPTDPKSLAFAAKHVMDRVLAALALVLLALPLAAVALGVKLSSPGPILYRQQRAGRDGRVFEMLKLRTMRPATGDEAQFDPGPGLAPGGVEGIDRRTAIGRWLRRTAIDELPQLVNVLRGEMSLVGPRPERPAYAKTFALDVYRYDDRQRVKSGITGWAQVNGLRGRSSLADRVEWDNYYIDNWSFGLDLKILIMTVGAMFQKTDEIGQLERRRGSLGKEY
jgi:exopolysaccharide biosynthesis polyprenyl glycosylphosphotransferase